MPVFSSFFGVSACHCSAQSPATTSGHQLSTQPSRLQYYGMFPLYLTQTTGNINCRYCIRQRFVMLDVCRESFVHVRVVHYSRHTLPFLFDLCCAVHEFGYNMPFPFPVSFFVVNVCVLKFPGASQGHPILLLQSTATLLCSGFCGDLTRPIADGHQLLVSPPRSLVSHISHSKCFFCMSRCFCIMRQLLFLQNILEHPYQPHITFWRYIQVLMSRTRVCKALVVRVHLVRQQYAVSFFGISVFLHCPCMCVQVSGGLRRPPDLVIQFITARSFQQHCIRYLQISYRNSTVESGTHTLPAVYHARLHHFHLCQVVAKGPSPLRSFSMYHSD